MSYGPMSMLALQPFMCYSHPNGSQSLLRQPSIVCGEGDHRAMLVAGCLLLVLISCFWQLTPFVVFLALTEQRGNNEMEIG